MSRYLAAAIQMDTQADREENFRTLEKLIAQAAEQGAKLICMPECVTYLGRNIADAAEEVPGGPSFRFFSAQAKRHGVWLHCGSIYEKSGDQRPYNCTMLLNPQGELVARYRKLHPFDVVLPNGTSVRESDTIRPGDSIVTAQAGRLGRLGFAICYDMRFGELFRLMALEGAQIFVVPANFTLATGKDHWLPLLRARAIENGCYVIAPGQIGKKPQFEAFGHSLIIDPWGTVTACASHRPGVVLAEIDLDLEQQVRRQLFTLENRREDLYTLARKAPGEGSQG